MNLLVGVTGVQAWQESIKASPEHPRLPLPYAFAAAFRNRNHKLFAIDYDSFCSHDGTASPFEQIFNKVQLTEAIKSVDMACHVSNVGLSIRDVTVGG
jgi:hypothetical protein